MVSICIPTYNGERYLRDTLDSVSKQTYTDLEIIINDDCSSDETVIVANNYAKYDKRIKIYQNTKNIGLVQNWNKTIRYASGKYLKLMCQDDLLYEMCILEQMQVLEKYQEVSLVTTASFIIDDYGKKYFKRKEFNKDIIIDGKKIIKKSISSGKNFIGEPSLIMYRKEAIKKVGIYNEKYNYVPDWEFSLRLLELGNLYYLSNPHASFRVSKQTETGNLFGRKYLSTLKEEFAFFREYNKSLRLGVGATLFHHFRVIIRSLLKLLFIKHIIKNR